MFWEEVRPPWSFRDSNLDLVLSPKAVVPSPIARCLRDYQVSGVRFLYSLYDKALKKEEVGCGGLLVDDMGLGKTIQVISLLAAILRKTNEKKSDCSENDDYTNHPKRFLIVSPASVLYNWESELDTWGYFRHGRFHERRDRETVLNSSSVGRLEIVLTTFETARDCVDALNQIPWDGVIVDEVHKIKEPKSKVTIALKRIKSKFRLGLTGTALQNRYEELWCLLDWANPGCLGTSKDFATRFSIPIERGLRNEASKIDLSHARDLQRQLDLIKSEWMLRRTKQGEMKDRLPAKEDRIVFCPPTPCQLSVFQTLLNSEKLKFVLSSKDPCDCQGGTRTRGRCCYPTDINSGKSWQSLLFTFIHLFLKVSNHVALLLKEGDSNPEASQAVQTVLETFPEIRSLAEISDAKYSGKFKVLVDLLAALNRESSNKILLFSNSITVLNIVEAFVQTRSYSYRRIDGSIKSQSRIAIIREFNQNPNIFILLISTKAGSLGLNITGANVVIIFDPNWNPAHDLQAQDRAYRIGQTRNVRIFRLITAGTIEETIYRRQLYKQQLSRNAIDGEKLRRTHNMFGFKSLFIVKKDLFQQKFRMEDNLLETEIHSDDLWTIAEEEEPLKINQSFKSSPASLYRTNSGIIFYGQTPSLLRDKDFGLMAEYLELSKKELAEKILQSTEPEIAKLLRDFYYECRQISGTKEIFDQVIDIDSEIPSSQLNKTDSQYFDLKNSSNAEMTISLQQSESEGNDDNDDAMKQNDFKEEKEEFPKRSPKPAPQGVFYSQRQSSPTSPPSSLSDSNFYDAIFGQPNQQLRESPERLTKIKRRLDMVNSEGTQFFDRVFASPTKQRHSKNEVNRNNNDLFTQWIRKHKVKKLSSS